jgi:hypothetical protein
VWLGGFEAQKVLAWPLLLSRFSVSSRCFASRLIFATKKGD